MCSRRLEMKAFVYFLFPAPPLPLLIFIIFVLGTFTGQLFRGYTFQASCDRWISISRVLNVPRLPQRLPNFIPFQVPTRQQRALCLLPLHTHLFINLLVQLCVQTFQVSPVTLRLLIPNQLPPRPHALSQTPRPPPLLAMLSPESPIPLSLQRHRLLIHRPQIHSPVLALEINVSLRVVLQVTDLILCCKRAVEQRRRDGDVVAVQLEHGSAGLD